MARRPEGHAMPKPTAKTIRQMLDDIQHTIAGWFTESPDPTGGALYMPAPPGSRHGVPFAELSLADRSDLLYSLICWQDYQARGVTEVQVLRVWTNVAEGKPRVAWLAGTGL